MKSEEKTNVLPEKDNSTDTSEDDLFTDLVVNNPTTANPTCQHLDEIKDLNITG